MREFYEGFQRQSIGEIHNGFANMDRLSLILKKQQLLLYPEGQAIASLRHEHWRGQATDSNPVSLFFFSKIFLMYYSTFSILIQQQTILWSYAALSGLLGFSCL